MGIMSSIYTPKDKRAHKYPDILKKGIQLTDRSFQKFTQKDLDKLLKFAEQDLNNLAKRIPKFKQAKKNKIAVCLCQGGGLHYIDGKNGVRDFDVYTFYQSPTNFPPRRRVIKDFGKSQFGNYSGKPEFGGRVVDIIGRTIPTPFDNPVDNLQNYLKNSNTGTAYYLNQKGVVMLWPDMGRVIWNKGKPISSKNAFSNKLKKGFQSEIKNDKPLLLSFTTLSEPKKKKRKIKC